MVKLRNLTENDAQNMLEWMNDSRISDAFQESMSHRTIDDAIEFIHKYQDIDVSGDNCETIHLAIADEDDEYLGTISLKKIDYRNKNAEYAIVTRYKVHGTGAAAEATKAILKMAFEQLKLERVYLTVLQNNVRAKNFYEKIGFKYEGTQRKQLVINGVYINWDMYGLLREDYYKTDKRVIHQINKVKMLEFPEHGDERGHLVVVEGESEVPFKMARCFYIYGSDSDVVRGMHANKRSQFVLINVAGKSKVRVKDGEGNEAVYNLDKPHTGLYLPQMVWKEMYDFSPDSVLLVIASEHYDPEEYIRTYDEFEKLIAEK